MSDPYDRSKLPEKPARPPVFSPLRPLRLGVHAALRFWLLEDDFWGWRESTPWKFIRAWFALGVSAIPGAVFIAWMVGYWFLGWVGSVVVLLALRAALRSMMHLDEPQSQQWWEDRLG